MQECKQLLTFPQCNSTTVITPPCITFAEWNTILVSYSFRGAVLLKHFLTKYVHFTPSLLSTMMFKVKMSCILLNQQKTWFLSESKPDFIFVLFTCMNDAEDYNYGHRKKKMQTWARCFLLHLRMFYIHTATENNRFCQRIAYLFINVVNFSKFEHIFTLLCKLL